METGDCYSMSHNGKIIRFRYMKYTSIDNTYYLRLCGHSDEIRIQGLTIENINSLKPIDCVDCDGDISATDKLRQ